MRDNKEKEILPENFKTLEELEQFWDTHSTADYEDEMETIEVKVDLSSNKVYFSVAKDILQKIRTQAQSQGVSTETLINLWLQEKLHSTA